MRIGIGAPCHVDDKKYIPGFNTAIEDMTRKPDAVYVYENDGSEGLGVARRKVFDHLFHVEKCSVVLMCSIDHHLFPDILKHVDPFSITGFGYMAHKPADFVSIVKRLFSPFAWTGVYSIPRIFWNWFKRTPWAHKWDGEGDSIQWFALDEGINIHVVKSPKYWLLRYSERMKEYATELGGRRAVLKLMDAW